MVFAAYEFVQKRAERKGLQQGLQQGLQRGLQQGLQQGQKQGQDEERERIEREVDTLFSNSDSDRVPIEDVLRIVRGNEE